MTVPAPADPPHGPRRAWAAVLLLMLVGTINLGDRFLPGVLAEPIKHDLQLTDTALGLINGFGFLFVYAVMGIPIARVADRGVYGLVISICLTTWSVMTMLGGLAHGAWTLALARMGVALGEAGNTPAAHAYISRNFAPDRRAAPLAVLSLSIPCSGAAALVGGGLLGQALGWRAAFFIVGLVGVLLAPAVLLMLGARQAPAPVLAPATGQKRPGVLQLLRKRSYIGMLAGSAFITLGGVTGVTFGPALLMRADGMSVGEVGVQYGIAYGVCSAAGLIITSRIADRLVTRDARWPLWTVAAVITIILPITVLGYLVEGRLLPVWCLGLSTIVGTAWMPLVIGSVQRLTPVEQRATASAILLFCNGIVGASGPVITGMISDALQPHFGARGLGYALLFVPFTYLLAIVSYLLASRWFLGDLIERDDHASVSHKAA